MPQAIHESTAFNSRNRKVAIHCVFSVKDNTLSCWVRDQKKTSFAFALISAEAMKGMRVV